MTKIVRFTYQQIKDQCNVWPDGLDVQKGAIVLFEYDRGHEPMTARLKLRSAAVECPQCGVLCWVLQPSNRGLRCLACTRPSFWGDIADDAAAYMDCHLMQGNIPHASTRHRKASR